MVVVVIATICALAWMCYRVSALLNIPIPTLVKLLGLDLPAPPRVSLHGVSSDTITLHWSLPEKPGTVSKHIIQINGVNVGESEKRGETSVTVTGLNADQRYNVRVIAANSQNFQAPGQLIRLRTRRKSQCSNTGVTTRGESSDDAALPAVVSTLDVPPSPQQQGRGHGGSKKSAKDRRNSPATIEQSNTPGRSKAEEQHTVESLTKDLDRVRNDIQETEAQLAVSEEEFKNTEAVLRSELDALKEKKNEEDVARQRIRAETKTLEEARRTAEAVRSRTEKALKAKQYEVKKMQDDIARWEAERVVALEKVQELQTAAQESKENVAMTEKEIGSDIRETQSQICTMEEEIRSLVGIIKGLENEKEKIKSAEEQESLKAWEDNESERQWKERQHNLELRYMSLYQAVQAAELEYRKSYEALQAHQGRRESGSGADSIKKQKTRRSRTRKNRTTMAELPTQEPRFTDSYGLNAGLPYQQISPTFGNTAPGPFFNYAVTSPTEISDPDTGPIMDSFPGGVPMSPTADALLPSNLFAYEDSPPSPKPSLDFLDDLHSRNGAPGYLGTHSPISESVSASTSPRSSLNHIPLFNLPSSTPISPEQQSVNLSPIGSNRPGSSSAMPHGTENTPPHLNGSRRFVRLFSNSLTPFTRQRGKTLPMDGNLNGLPLIGSLKPSEHHSFPRNDPPGLDPIGTRRRSGSYGSWNGNGDIPHDSAWGKSQVSLGRADSTASRRSATLNQFNPSFDPIDPQRLFDPNPTSPRPSSISSFDQHFPVPSSDASAAFGWPAAPPGLFNAHWASRFTRSRPVSRPISPNATANVSATSLSLHPSQNHPLSNTTAPPPGHTFFSPAPRLNPTAPTFQVRGGDAGDASMYDRNDALSIKTDISATTASTTDTGTSLEMVATKESILSRFSALSRKSSTGKFNMTWNSSKKDKEGSMEKEREKDKKGKALKEEDESTGNHDHHAHPGFMSFDSSATVTPATPTPNSSSRHLWQPWKKVDTPVEAGEDGKNSTTVGKEKDPFPSFATTSTTNSETTTTATKTKDASKPSKDKKKDKASKTKAKAKDHPSPFLPASDPTVPTITTNNYDDPHHDDLKESSPWIQSAGFFGTIGRRKEKEKDKHQNKPADEDAAVDSEDGVHTPVAENVERRTGLGIFRRKEKEEKGGAKEEVGGECV